MVAAGAAAATLVATSLIVAPSAGADDHDEDYGKYYDEWGTGGESKCSTKLSPVKAYAHTRSHDQWTNAYNKLTVHESKNSADYRTCKGDKPVPLKKITGFNTYTFTGPKLDKVTPAASLSAPLALPLVLTPGAALAAEFIGDKYVVSDREATSCENCAYLDFDQQNVVVAWQAGIVTHYQHDATAVYTGENGSTITTTSRIDSAC